jgi:hypothetical protein
LEQMGKMARQAKLAELDALVFPLTIPAMNWRYLLC